MYFNSHSTVFRTEHRSQALVDQQAGLGGKRRGGAVGISRGSAGGEDGLVAEDDDEVLVDESAVRFVIPVFFVKCILIWIYAVFKGPLCY